MKWRQVSVHTAVQDSIPVTVANKELNPASTLLNFLAWAMP